LPVVYRNGPYRFLFFGADRREPPHIHVQRERFWVKYWLAPIVRLSGNDGFRPHELNRIERLVHENREQLLEQWREFFRQ
jgi:hypothetical protein